VKDRLFVAQGGSCVPERKQGRLGEGLRGVGGALAGFLELLVAGIEGEDGLLFGARSHGLQEVNGFLYDARSGELVGEQQLVGGRQVFLGRGAGFADFGRDRPPGCRCPPACDRRPQVSQVIGN